MKKDVMAEENTQGKTGRWRMALAAAAVVLVAVGSYLYFQRQTQPVAPQEDETPDRALAVEGYTGAESCRECHQKAYEVWAQSAHARAMAAATPENVQGDFTRDTTYTYDGQSYKMFSRDGGYYIQAPNREGIPETYRAVYILGARQHENYLARFPDGRYQMLPVYYDLVQKRWYDSAEGTLEIGQSLNPDDFYFWANHGRTWNKRCFDCHCSQMRKNYDLPTDTYNTAIGDLSVNCEACHGPGAAHVRFWQDAAEDPTLAQQEDRTLPRLKQLSATQQVETCAQCHALKTVLRSGYVPGDDFQDYYEPFLIDNEDSYWPDGLAKKLAYPYLQFAGSECFRQAGLTCNGCHADHGSDRTAELVQDPGGVGLCARCHPEIAADVRGHTHHSPSGPGGDCNACHLPQMFRNQLVMTDHRIGVPVPEATVALGIPNACNQAGCHADKPPEWASEWSQKWYGDYQGARVARTVAIDRGRKGDAGPVGVLQGILGDGSEDPLLRAGVASIVGDLGSLAALPELVVALGDTHSVVRSQAAVALGKLGHPGALLPLAGALFDSVFSVRTRAAFSLIMLDFVPTTVADRQRHEAALEELRSVVEGRGMMADDAEMHLNLGQVRELQHNFQAALQHYRYALRFAPGLPEAQGRMERLLEGEARYRKLVEMLAPRADSDPRASMALGLAHVHRGRLAEGIALLKRAVTAGGRSEMVQFGLGEAYRKQGKFGLSGGHYRAALAIWPDFSDAHRGLAFLAFASGAEEEGRHHWAQFRVGLAKAEGASRVREFLQKH